MSSFFLRGGAVTNLSFTNNMLFNPTGKNASIGLKIEDGGGALGTETWSIDNNTVYGFTDVGIFGDNTFGSGATLNVRNNISVANGLPGGDYNVYSPTAFSDNLSSDATGTAGLTSKPAVDQFKDATRTIAAVDMHLKAGADAIDVGANLGTTNDVNLDIAQYDRTAGTWDLGAGELSSGPVAITKSFTDGIKAEESFLKNTNNIFDDLVYSGTIEDTIIYSGTVEDLGSLGSLEEQQVYSGLIEEI